MSAVPRPDTTDEMVEQLWYAIIGSNGDGIASRLRRVETSQEEMKVAQANYVATRQLTCPNVASLKTLEDVVRKISQQPAALALKIVTYVFATMGIAFLALVLGNAPQIIKVLVGAAK